MEVKYDISSWSIKFRILTHDENFNHSRIAKLTKCANKSILVSFYLSAYRGQDKCNRVFPSKHGLALLLDESAGFG